ncbi:MAG: type I-E CRISPR-associated protein Cas6/Cse3/CasE [Asticcacaulis sp.]
MSDLFELMVSLPDGTLQQPQRFHNTNYQTFLREGGERDFLFKGVKLAGEAAIVRSRHFAECFAPMARPITYSATQDAYDFHLCASPQYRDRATQKLQFLPPSPDNAHHISWLKRKAAGHGFILDGETVCERRIKRVPEKGNLSIDECEFSGHLTVVDHALFVAALEHGIGPRSAYGYGLLTLY